LNLSGGAATAATAGTDPNTPDTSYLFDALGPLDTASTFPGSTPTVILSSNKLH